MPHLIVENFQAGLDKRKLPVTSTPGTLISLQNGHITRGGEIQKRLALVKEHDLPADTFGLAAAAGQFYTFGSVATPGGPIPPGITYQQLDPGDGRVMNKAWSHDFFDGKTYVAAGYENNTVEHYYDTALVTDIAAQGFTPGKFVRTFRTKMYWPSGSLLVFSNVNDPTTYKEDDTPDPPLVGAGFINMSNEAAGSENLQSVGTYFDNLGVLARKAIQIWFMDVDPGQNVQLQVLNNTGTIAPRSTTEYGDNDLFYLAESGIRSLQARNSSNAAFVSDVGTAIDTLIHDTIHLDRAAAEEAIGFIEPHEGRFLLSIGQETFVFSFFPASSISAWSSYSHPFTVTDWAADTGAEEVIAARGDDNGVYFLGGTDGQTYDETEVVARLPFLNAGNPVQSKSWNRVNIAAKGTWEVTAYTQTGEDVQDIGEPLGQIMATSFDDSYLPIDRESTHISLEFKSVGSGEHVLGLVAITHDEDP